MFLVTGRFPFLIAISTIFIAGSISGFGASIVSTLAVIFVILLGIFFTLVVSRLLSKTILKGIPSSFVLELPPYRKPQFGKILVRSLFDRTLFVLGRAVSVAAPAGLIIWLFANIGIDGQSLLDLVANFLQPFASLMGLDGYILTAFILGIPANEIVLPIILMCYLGGSSLVNLEDTFSIGQILISHGWTILTAINVMLFTVLHYPCATTLLTIKKETGSWKWTFLSFLLPTVLRCFGLLFYEFSLSYFGVKLKRGLALFFAISSFSYFPNPSKIFLKNATSFNTSGCHCTPTIFLSCIASIMPSSLVATT